eukprot:1150960-Pelagomonas_calceolata.AAC.2
MRGRVRHEGWRPGLYTRCLRQCCPGPAAVALCADQRCLWHPRQVAARPVLPLLPLLLRACSTARGPRWQCAD